MTTEPLSAAEAKWLKKLNKLLAECPSERIGFYTIGDPAVEMYDLGRQAEIDELMDKGKDFSPSAEKLGAKLGTLRFPSCVHSTAG